MLTQIHSRVRRLRWIWGVLGVVSLWCSAIPAAAQEGELPELPEVSYIHAAVLGTGSYVLNERRVTMFRMPFAWNQRPETEDSPGWRWLFPLTLGYDELDEINSDIIDALWPDQLVTLSFMPGFEYRRPIGRNWLLKPFIELGGGRDFSSGETYALTQLGMRAVALFEPGERWQVRWGVAIRWAGEYQFESEETNAFGIFDTGFDVRRATPWRLFDQPLDLGAYYVFQRFLPHMTLGEADDWRGRARELHEFGLSLGIPDGRKILSIPVSRVRVGYKKGGQFQGWTLGTEFPI